MTTKKKKPAKKRTDKKLVKKWIEALESGKYKKCIHVLHRTKNTFCALGVLCDVYDPTKWEKDTYRNTYMYNMSSCSNLISCIEDKVNLSSESCNEIIRMNDCKRKSFKEIAKYLRELYNIKD